MAQNQCQFFTKLPPDIRDEIYCNAVVFENYLRLEAFKENRKYIFASWILLAIGEVLRMEVQRCGWSLFSWYFKTSVTGLITIL